MSKQTIDQLKEAASKAGLTQEELAHKLHVSMTTINRWFRGKHKPTKHMEYQISEFIAGQK